MALVKINFDAKTDDLLVWNGQIVMSRSEETYFETIFSRIQHLKPAKVLEVGFGLGISASIIQRTLKPRQHDIVEIEQGIFSDLEAFSAKNPSVKPHKGDWLDADIKGPYDLIFYDPYDYTTATAPQEEQERKTKRIKELLAPRGAYCHPHFGDGPVPDIPGLETIILERLVLPPFLVANGSTCQHAAVVIHTHPS